MYRLNHFLGVRPCDCVAKLRVAQGNGCEILEIDSEAKVREWLWRNRWSEGREAQRNHEE